MLVQKKRQSSDQQEPIRKKVKFDTPKNVGDNKDGPRKPKPFTKSPSKFSRPGGGGGKIHIAL